MPETGIKELAFDRLPVGFLPGAAQRTLETMFFAVPDTVSASTNRPPGDLIAASLTFRGEPHGGFGLLVSEPLARTLAGNFSCRAEDDIVNGFGPDGLVNGVVAELANMICGAALTRVESNAAFDIAAPAAFRLADSEPMPTFAEDSPSTIACRLEFPEGVLVAFLEFETSI